MPRSSTQLVKSHGDDLSLEYLWNGDESNGKRNAVFGVDILYYPEERDDKGELIKVGHYVLYLGELHCRVNLKMKRFILWVTMLLFAQKQMIGSRV